MRLVTRALFSIGFVAGRLSLLVNTLAVSTLTLEEVRVAIRTSWDGFNNRDDEIAMGLTSWEEDLVARFIAPGAEVLVVGAGTGRDVIALAQRQCRVTGIEPSAAALGIGRRALAERGLPATLIEGFFEDVDVAGRFDVVIFSNCTYNSIPGARRRGAALRKAALLSDGGPVVVSYTVMRGPSRAIIRLAARLGALSGSDWRAEPGDRAIVHSGALHGYVHGFQPGEVEAEAAAAGLKLVFQHAYPDGVSAFAARLP